MADCGFCGFAAGTTEADDYVMPAHVLRRCILVATAGGLVSSISLMTIHGADVGDILTLWKWRGVRRPRDNEYYYEDGIGNTVAAVLARMRSRGYSMVRGAGGRVVPIPDSARPPPAVWIVLRLTETCSMAPMHSSEYGHAHRCS